MWSLCKRLDTNKSVTTQSSSKETPSGAESLKSERAYTRGSGPTCVQGRSGESEATSPVFAVSVRGRHIWERRKGASSKGRFSVINCFISFSTFVTRYLLYIQRAFFPHSPEFIECAAPFSSSVTAEKKIRP